MKVSLFEVREHKDCAEAYSLNRLGLTYSKKPSVNKAVLRPLVKELHKIVELGRDAFNAMVREKVDELYTEDLQEIKIGLEEDKELFTRKFIRLADYLRDKLTAEEDKPFGKGRINFHIPFETEISGLIGEGATHIKDSVDFIYTLDGKTTAVKIVNGTNEHTPRVRSLEKLAKNKLELILTYLGLAVSEDDAITVEEWYLTSKKDDPKKDIFAEFDGKPGENIASATYQTRQEAREALQRSLSFCKQRECENCRHSAVCHKVGAKLNLETKLAKDAVASQPKEPRFTDAQQKVVAHGDGPMCVVAVPGAGKTTSLVHRLKRLLESGVKADEILFISFTKKAAGEIKERVEALLPEGSEIPNIFTFNAFGYHLLKENKSLIGRQLCLASETDRKRIVEECLPLVPQINGFSYKGARLERGIIPTAAGWMQDIMTLGEDAFREKNAAKDTDGILRLYQKYLQKFKECGFITFDEQISLSLKLVKEHPEVAKSLAQRYRYIMVDEYQDTNEEQAELIYTIAKHHNNLVVVGDDDQNIYAWRGGSADYMLNFDKDFPGAQIVHMSDNFRSNDKILTAANSLIEENANRFEKTLVAHSQAENKPVYYADANMDKCMFIVSHLLKKYKPGEIAVLTRKNGPLLKLEKELSKLCNVAKSKSYLIDDYVFRLVKDVFSCYLDLNDDVALYRLFRHFGAEVPEKVKREEPLYCNLRMQELILPMNIYEPDDFYAYEEKENRTSIEEAAFRIFKAMKACQYYSTMEELFDKVCDELGIPRDQLVINQLREQADFHAFENIVQMHGYMTAMVDYSDTLRTDYTPDLNTLPLMTCHESKGKEFPCVIIYGTEEFTATEDDNRLLYVAMTRAKTNLFMLRTDISKENESIDRISSHLMMR